MARCPNPDLFLGSASEQPTVPRDTLFCSGDCPFSVHRDIAESDACHVHTSTLVVMRLVGRSRGGRSVHGSHLMPRRPCRPCPQRASGARRRLPTARRRPPGDSSKLRFGGESRACRGPPAPGSSGCRSSVGWRRCFPSPVVGNGRERGGDRGCPPVPVRDHLRWPQAGRRTRRARTRRARSSPGVDRRFLRCGTRVETARRGTDLQACGRHNPCGRTLWSFGPATSPGCSTGTPTR
jgi:hypothetical protein